MDKRKVVIRKLPPSASEADVREVVDKAAKGMYTWFSFVPGKASMKRIVHSRCYVYFEDPAHIPGFKLAVEQRAFVTDRGAQYRGCVEYAPFQKIPEGKVKRDPREGTLETDPEYLAYVEGLEAQPEALPSAEAQAREASSAVADQAPQVTALMAYLQERHAVRKSGVAGLVRGVREGKPADRDPKIRESKLQQQQKSAKMKAARGDGIDGQHSRDAPVMVKRRSRAVATGSEAASLERSKESVSNRAATTKERDEASKTGDPQSLGADDRESKDEKPVKVRAGFQVYQPKRLGRLAQEASAQGPTQDDFSNEQQSNQSRTASKEGMLSSRDRRSRGSASAR